MRKFPLPRDIARWAKACSYSPSASGLYLGTLLATVFAPWWPLKLFFSLANAFFLSTLFVIGHDACHEAFVPYRWLNAVLGRIAFCLRGTRTPVGSMPTTTSTMSGPTCGPRISSGHRFPKRNMTVCRRGGGQSCATIARCRAWEHTISSRSISSRSFFPTGKYRGRKTVMAIFGR